MEATNEKKGFNFKEFWATLKKDKKKMFFVLFLPFLVIAGLVTVLVMEEKKEVVVTDEVLISKSEVSAIDVPVIDSASYSNLNKPSKTELYRSDFFSYEEEQRLLAEQRQERELEELLSVSNQANEVQISTAHQKKVVQPSYSGNKYTQRKYSNYSLDEGFSSKENNYSNNSQAKAQPKAQTESETVPPLQEESAPQKRRRVPSDNYGNMTAKKASKKELYRAVVANENKLVKSGSSVKIRIGEDMDVDGLLLKRNSIIIGTASMNRERMSINISSVKIDEQIKFVKWEIYSEDGNEGIAIPPSILNKMGTDASEEAIDKSKTSVETKVPFLGSLKVNLKKKVQDVEFVLTSGHKIYIKEKRN